MVGLGDTKKKLQTMIDSAEELYAKMNELLAEIDDLRTKVDETAETVDSMDHRLAEQQALVEALAEDADIDVDQVLADAAIEDVEANEENHEPAGAAGGSAAEPED